MHFLFISVQQILEKKAAFSAWILKIKKIQLLSVCKKNVNTFLAAKETYQSFCDFMLHQVKKKGIKDDQSILKPGPLQSQRDFFSSCSHSFGVHRYNVCVPPSWCTWGLYGNQYGITWLWRTIRANQWDDVERQKYKIKDKITNLCLSLLFTLCQKKMYVLFYVFMLFFLIIILFMQAWMTVV